MDINLEQLGITQEQLIEKVVDRISEELLWDAEDGYANSKFARRVKKHIDEKVNASVSAVADKYMVPAFLEHLEGMRFETTNGYGEPKTEPKTLREFIAHRAENYLDEVVDREGKTRRQGNSFAEYGTRAKWLVDRFFTGSVTVKLKEYVDAANDHLSKGLTGALTDGINELLTKLNVTIKSSRR